MGRLIKSCQGFQTKDLLVGRHGRQSSPSPLECRAFREVLSAIPLSMSFNCDHLAVIANLHVISFFFNEITNFIDSIIALLISSPTSIIYVAKMTYHQFQLYGQDEITNIEVRSPIYSPILRTKSLINNFVYRIYKSYLAKLINYFIKLYSHPTTTNTS